jgi:hypothetical protein
MTVILGICMGIYLIIGTIFVAPTWKTLVSFGIMTVVLIIFDGLTITDPRLGFEDLIIYSLGGGLGIAILLAFIDVIRFRFKAFPTHPLWDFSTRFKKIANTNAYCVIFAIFLVELILELEGLTVFVWL